MVVGETWSRVLGEDMDAIVPGVDPGMLCASSSFSSSSFKSFSSSESSELTGSPYMIKTLWSTSADSQSTGKNTRDVSNLNLPSSPLL